MALIPFFQNDQLQGEIVIELPCLGSVAKQGTLTTPDAAAHAILAFPLADGTYQLTTSLVARNKATGDSCSFLSQALVKVALGIPTVVGQANTSLNDAGFAPTQAWAPNLTNLELQVTGLAATDIKWSAEVSISAVPAV